MHTERTFSSVGEFGTVGVIATNKLKMGNHSTETHILEYVRKEM